MSTCTNASDADLNRFIFGTNGVLLRIRYGPYMN